MTPRELDVRLPDGRTLHAHDTGGEGLVVMWHHGTPNIGRPPDPLFAVAERLGMRWLSYDRPGYGGSSPQPGRSVGDAATHSAAVVDQFAAMGHSGGAVHALACGALLPGRVRAVAAVSALAPYGVDGLDWFDGMGPAGVAALRAATEGREAK
jgi:pimeloyl-ACP methyl ester carboxylesterase